MARHFKPLWAIHNAVYRAYRKELVQNPCVAFGKKVLGYLRSTTSTKKAR